MDQPIEETGDFMAFIMTTFAMAVKQDITYQEGAIGLQLWREWLRMRGQLTPQADQYIAVYAKSLQIAEGNIANQIKLAMLLDAVEKDMDNA